MMRARTHVLKPPLRHRRQGRLAFLALLTFLSAGALPDPVAAFEGTPFTGLEWYDPNSGNDTVMAEGGTYAMPLRAAGVARVWDANGTHWDVVGALYEESATSTDRVFVGDFDGLSPTTFAWPTAGRYELELYDRAPPVLPRKSWRQRALALLVPRKARAQAAPQALDTVHFTIHDSSATPKTDNVLFIPGTEASRLYMRTPVGTERQLWEPSFYTAISALALNADGTSVNRVYTKDIIGALYDNAGARGALIESALRDDAKVYGGFERYLDSLVASTTVGMNEWEAYPYDWRYDPADIVNEGTLTEMPDDSLRRVYLEDVVDRLASSSATGKVTIVAHSNGGLVAKALLVKLGAEGKTKEVGRLIMIGTPQWGTPSAIGSMLHGDGQTLGLGIVAQGNQVRAAAATMPDPYALLPAASYFSHVKDPVVVFVRGMLTSPFKQYFPSGITTPGALSAFVTDELGLDQEAGSSSNLDTPLALNPDLLAKAEATHATLDAWIPPSGVAVTAIVGWGQPTVYSYAYETMPGHLSCSSPKVCSRDQIFTHVPLETDGGDGTVIDESAIGDVSESWYLNIQQLDTNLDVNINHQDLLAADPVKDALGQLLAKRSVQSQYLVHDEPISQDASHILLINKSPIYPVAVDTQGRRTGIIPIPSTEFYYAVQEIPGSSVRVSGTEKYLELPYGTSYTLSEKGYDSGPANIEIAQLDAQGAETASSTVADIPITSSTTAAFSISVAGVPSPIVLDLDGNGVSDATITPVAGTTTSFLQAVDPLQYLTYVIGQIRRLNLERRTKLDITHKLSVLKSFFEHEQHGRRNELMKKAKSRMVEEQLSQLEAYVSREERRRGHTRLGLPADQGDLITSMIEDLKQVTRQL